MQPNESIYTEYQTILKRVGEQIAQRRRLSGLTQTQLAKRIGKNQSIVAKVEKYPSKDITFRCIYEVCAGLSLSMGDLVATVEHQIKDDESYRGSGDQKKRMKRITETLTLMHIDDQKWFADVIECLLEKSTVKTVKTVKTDLEHRERQ